MIIIHLFTGLVFGALSVLYSLHAGHGFFLGLFLYSGIGVCGLCLSALFFWVRPWFTATAGHIALRSGLWAKGFMSDCGRPAGVNSGIIIRGHRSGRL